MLTTPHKQCTLDDLRVTSSLEPCLPGPGLGPCTIVFCSSSPLGDSEVPVSSGVFKPAVV